MDYHSEDITPLSLREGIRMRPRLHFKECFEQQSINVFPFEYLCHAFDEYFDGKKIKIDITLGEKTFLIRYNCGISLEEKEFGVSKPERMMTMLMVCSNEKKHLAVGEKYCRIGMALLNFASTYCILQTASEGKMGYFRFEEGEMVANEIKPFEGEAFTTLEVLPDYNLLDDLRFDFEGVQSIADQINAELEGIEIVVGVK